MSDRLADVSARLEGIRQLDTVVNAMAGIAAARARQARGQIDAVDAYAATIASAMERIVGLAPDADPQSAAAAPRTALVVFCAEQGFAGAFSERVLDAIGPDISKCEVFLIGSRGETLAATRSIVADWRSAMPSHSPNIPKFADRVADALFGRIGSGEIDCLDAVFTAWKQNGPVVERRRLFPVDLSAQAHDTSGDFPLLNLPAETLLVSLGRDYVHALICNAALHAFAAENEARMAAMAAARNQIGRELTALSALERRVRQEAITAEIIELATGEAASRDRAR